MTYSRFGISTHVRMLLVLIVLVFPVRFALKDRYAAERRRIETKGQIQRARELGAKWNALRYVDAPNGRLSDAFLDKVDLGSLRLSDLQKAKLESRLREVLDYLQNPSLEAYLRLKTQGLHFTFGLSTNVTRLFATAYSNDESCERR